MEPNFERAKEEALKIAKQNGIVCPLTILKRIPGVLVVSYAETSKCVGIDRQQLLTMFGEHDQDAFTTARIENGKNKYIVIYNQQLTCKETRYALARELGHIVLGHDGTRPEATRNAEAICFADNLIGAIE